MLERLIFINAAVFLLLTTLRVIGQFGWDFADHFADSEAFGLAVSWKMEWLLSRPWTVVTHLFAHVEIWHLLMNMLVLWWAGRWFMAEQGERRLLSTYLMGGLAGFLVYAVLYNVFPTIRHGGVWAMGASAAVMSILVGAATSAPEREIGLILLGRVKLKYIAIAYLLLDYFGLGAGENIGGSIGHLGGALYGFIVVRSWQRGGDLNAGMERILDALASLMKSSGKGGPRTARSGGRSGGSRQKRGRKMRAVKNSRQSSRPVTDDQFNEAKARKEKQLDAILDKISKHGYDNLTKEEKDFLFRQSSSA
jgi:membrane associated rhomboid family serine protease